MNRRQLVFTLLLCLSVSSAIMAQGTRMLRHPTVSRDSVAFEYAGEIWSVSRNGGTAKRLTSTPGVEIDPYFSPDGSRIAFAATVAGNTDVYIMPAAGGDARRLTFHPGADRVRGWSNDGRYIIFGSERVSAPLEAHTRLWKVSPQGGQPEQLPLPRAFSGSFSPDGSKLAYEEFPLAMFPGWFEASFWRHYRGGRTHPISIFNFATNSVETLPWNNSNDSWPMWVGNTIYFVSDRDHTSNIYAYRVDSKQATRLTNHEDFDVMTASAGPDAVVYEQAGYIHLLDTNSGRSRQLNIEVVGDLPWAQPQFKKVANMIRSAELSPGGIRAAFEARGDIFTVPSAKGDYRNLTASPGVHDRDPAWSPDGSLIAWFSDKSGEYQLMLGEPTGLTEPRAINLPSTAYFSSPVWSPGGEQILLDDNHGNLWSMDVKSGAFVKIDADIYPMPGRGFDASWSPDSKWIAYTKHLKSRLSAVYLYSVAQKKADKLTDALADSISPAFDSSGKYLYFLASTDFGLRTGWLEMSSLDHPTRRSVYLAVLSSGEPSPFLPETGDEPRPAASPAPGDAAKPKPAVPAGVRVDLENIGQRILPINVPAADYGSLNAGPAETIFFTEPIAGTGTLKLHKYQIKSGTAVPFLEGISQYSLSADKKKLLYGARGGRWGVVGTETPAKVGDGPLNVAQLETKVDPRAEWANIFRETWRIQREYFYDPEMQGADWNAIYKKYLPLVAHIGHRADLSYLIAQTGGELTVGHSYLTGQGDVPSEDPVSVGLLGADIGIENGKYRIKHIYSGENWNPELKAPLSAPGIDVAEGDYILEVNGKPLDPTVNFFSVFEGTANRQTVIRVSASPSREGSRLVTVVPVASEAGLRTRAWVESNRRLVDKLSGGRLAYVWLPNTAGPGYSSFIRYFYSQQDKEGTIVDVRYNQGGMVADFIANELDRKPMGFFTLRDGEPFTSPIAGIYGPKVMLINESAGSGGDALPFYFRLRKLGPLIGTRTWGALVGTLGTPTTIDGGGITAPSLAFYNLEGKFDVENVGVAPDIEVDYTPADVIKGRDPQIERAVVEAMKLVERNTFKRLPRPASLDRVSKPKESKR
jgi:tricorn protease